MNWQTPAALGIVALTAAIWLWRRLRSRRFDFHRDTGCGCSAPGVRPPNVLITGKRGERPQVTVKSI
jgi:hypothetical protein